MTIQITSLPQDILVTIARLVKEPRLTAIPCKHLYKITDLVYPVILNDYQKNIDLKPFVKRAVELYPQGSEKLLVQTIYALVINEAGFFFNGRNAIKNSKVYGPNKYDELRLSMIAGVVTRRKANDLNAVFSFRIASKCADAQAFLINRSGALRGDLAAMTYVPEGVELANETSTWIKDQADLSDSSLSKVPVLDLRWLALSFLPSEICYLKHLKKLFITNNQIVELPKEIGNLTDLTDLNLGGNRLEHLPEEMGNLTNLTTLDIARNPLPDLDQEIMILKKLEKLTTLYIDDEQSKKIPKEIFDLDNLKIYMRDSREPICLDPCVII